MCRKRGSQVSVRGERRARRLDALRPREMRWPALLL